ncbi:MAG TPA: peptidoglycan editing factor PgeF [Rhizomicrobium sp.]
MLVLRATNIATSAVRHGFFGRTGGISTGIYDSLNCGPGSGDAREAVVENRRRVAAALGPDIALVTAGQIHGTQTITVARAWAIGETPADDPTFIPLGDAMATATPGIALGILTADCAPVLFADAHTGVIGAAHAGWKGVLGGVIESVLDAMEKLGANRSHIAATIGPCIGQRNYEVGAEFRDRFAVADSANARFFIDSDRADHFRFDLEAYVVHRLGAAGVPQIEALHACTYAREADFFSFRRNTHRKQPNYGRQISAIALLP